MKTKKLQLAKLFRGTHFAGYGLAVDGVLISNLKSTNLVTNPDKTPHIIAEIHVSNEMINNTVDIELKN